MRKRCWFVALLVLIAGISLSGEARGAAQEPVLLAGPGWQIVHAEWGAGERRVDVTQRLRLLLSRGGMLRVNNENMGGDPAVGADKHLHIFARNEEGQQQEFNFREGSFINAGEFYNYAVAGDDGRPGWRVLWADYGIRERHVDVTDRVRFLLSHERMVHVDNQNMGGDPAVGADKTLRISARDAQGEIRHFSFREGDTIDARDFYQFRDMGDRPVERREEHYDRDAREDHDHERYDDRDRNHDRDRDRDFRDDAGHLRIVRAYYGLGNRTADVTDLVRSMVRENSIAIQVNNRNMGGDPAVGADKVLTVIYRWNDAEQTSTVREGNLLRIP